MSQKEIPMKKIVISFSLILAFLVPACAAASPAPFAMEPSGLAPMEQPASEPAGGFQADDAATSNVYAGTQPQVERIVLKNANLSIAVEDPALSVKTISAMAEEMGGFVVSANTYRTTLSNGIEVPQASLTVRVPAERLNEALERIRAETTQPVMNETLNSQDVTSEYTDLQSRLRNLETAEAQLQNIMDEARKTEEVLSVYQQLIQVREQIEVIKGQIQYIEQSAALSSINVEILTNAAVQPLTIGSWQPVGVARQAIQALLNTLQFLVNALIWIVLFIAPVLILILLPPGLIIWGLLRWRARRRAKKAA